MNMLMSRNCHQHDEFDRKRRCVHVSMCGRMVLCGVFNNHAARPFHLISTLASSLSSRRSLLSASDKATSLNPCHRVFDPLPASTQRAIFTPGFLRNRSNAAVLSVMWSRQSIKTTQEVMMLACRIPRLCAQNGAVIKRYRCRERTHQPMSKDITHCWAALELQAFSSPARIFTARYQSKIISDASVFRDAMAAASYLSWSSACLREWPVFGSTSRCREAAWATLSGKGGSSSV